MTRSSDCRGSSLRLFLSAGVSLLWASMSTRLFPTYARSCSSRSSSKRYPKSLYRTTVPGVWNVKSLLGWYMRILPPTCGNASEVTVARYGFLGSPSSIPALLT